MIGALEAAVRAAGTWRWLEGCCSLAAGRGDEVSDVDAGIGYGAALDPATLDSLGHELVHAAGEPIDVVAHVVPGWPPETRRFAVEYRNGVQLDLVLMPAARRVGLPTGDVAVVDKDGNLAQSWTPPVANPPTAAEAREWLLLGWWALSDVAKYVRRRSFPPYELPPNLAATYATPTSAQQVLAAANAIADLLPASPWEEVARARLSGA